MKKELLKNYYNSENKLAFHQFHCEYHSHFDALYEQIGIPAGSCFGGNEQGAIKIYPTGYNVRTGMVYVSLRGRGLWDGLNERQSISSDCCEFIDDDGSEVSAKDAIAWQKAEKSAEYDRIKKDKRQEREAQMPSVFRRFNNTIIEPAHGIKFLQTLYRGEMNLKCDGIKNADMVGTLWAETQKWISEQSNGKRTQSHAFGIVDDRTAVMFCGLSGPVFVLQYSERQSLQIIPMPYESQTDWIPKIQSVVIMKTTGLGSLYFMRSPYEMEA